MRCYELFVFPSVPIIYVPRWHGLSYAISFIREHPASFIQTNQKKKTKTYGLVGLGAPFRQGRSLSLPTLSYQQTNRYAVVSTIQAIYTRAITDYLLFWPSVGLDVWVFDILPINTISFQTTTHLIIYTRAKEGTCVSLKNWNAKRETCLGILKDTHTFPNKIALSPN